MPITQECNDKVIDKYTDNDNGLNLQIDKTEYKKCVA